ncbi:uncharacterized protein EI90DRAFT_3118447 [Cantharellus anzutake]|uniref:uncharacterized protein n=1 Tax=Cantharellus anzutake TaxID=1750568 RepID=UPI0019081E1B|nr:uncharacterized protein EI90DRAFT_3118447 [Cantharellus anzutake]KAF8337987.1 hypothetical protein EI90DRAFT_3118447 [Cantharellus anzutake]
MHSLYYFLCTLLLIAIAAPGAFAFGAGEIPDFAYLSDKAFRHGDLENTLKEMYKIVSGRHGGINLGEGIGGILAGVAGAMASRGTKFTSLDVKRVYLGNFLCDYSQAMDIAGLTKLSPESIVTIVMALASMSFGYATGEFEVTAERLGVYLPVTHIDNPRGYGGGQDPRDVYPKLRPPVNPEELEIDESNGMKNYIATEDRGWDTSTGLLKRVFRECIDRGRRAQGEDGEDLFEAFRLLGTGLHTLEDLLAHSNWCELTLRKLGHRDVFCYVGDNVLVNSPHGRVPPLVTGTFGSADFLHSLLGEATDRLSEASLTDLTKRLSSATANSGPGEGDSPIAKVISIFSKIPSLGGGDKEKLNKGENIKAKAFDLQGRIDEVTPQEVQKLLWEALVWRDDLMRGKFNITRTIENIPGLEKLLDQFTEALNVYVFTILEPFLTPILQKATTDLQEGSGAIIEAHQEDQFQVFNDPNASDPSHSLLSKDHFALILNEPAGKVAIVVLNLVVSQAWYDQNADIDRVIDTVLEAFHHPYYASGRSRVQKDMEDELRRWVDGLSSDERETILNNLTKEAVKEGQNKRAGQEDKASGDGQRQQYGDGEKRRQEAESYTQYGDQERRGGRQHQEEGYNQYGDQGTRGGRHQEEEGYNQYGDEGRRGGGRYQEESYNQYENEGRRGGRLQEEEGYDQYGNQGRRREETYGEGYSAEQEYRPQEGYSSGWNDRVQTSGYQSSRYETQPSEYGGGYRQIENAEGYGRRQEEEDKPRRDDQYSSYGRREEEPSYGRGSGRYGEEERGSRYGSGGEYGGGQESARYGGGRQGQEYTQSPYGGGGYGAENPRYQRRNEESYGRRDRREEGYNGSYGSGGRNTSGFEPRQEEEYGYGSRRREEGRGYERPDGYQGGGDDTFGAERLNLDDNEGGYERRSRNEYEPGYQHESQY